MTIGWELLAGGGVLAAVAFGIWLALLNAKKRGAAEERERQAEESYDAERDRIATDQTVRTATDAESDSVRDRYSRD